MRPAFAALNADPDVMRYFPEILEAREPNAVAHRCAARIGVEGYGLRATEVVESGEFIGFVGLNRPTWDAEFTPCTEVAGGSAVGLGPRVCDRGGPAPLSRWLSGPWGSPRWCPSPPSATCAAER